MSSKESSDTASLAASLLPPEQTLLLNAMREEFNAKLGSLKAWGIAALIGGQVVAGLVTAYIGPGHAAHAAASAARFFLS